MKRDDTDDENQVLYINDLKSDINLYMSDNIKQMSKFFYRIFISLFFIFLFVNLSSFVIASDVISDNPLGELPVIDKINDGFSNFINSDTGKINPNAINFGKSEAQKRIDSINLWLNENVGWLRFLFRMTPQISFLFMLNFIGILWGLVYLFLRFPTYIDFYNKASSYLIGFTIFIIFFLSNIPYYFARFGIYFFSFVNGLIKNTIIAFTITFVILIVLMMIFPAVSTFVIKLFAKKKSISLGGKNKEAEKILNENFDNIELRKKELDAYVEGLTGKKNNKE